MILVYDTETTGLPDFKKPAEDPSQPHIAQLGAILYNNGRRPVCEINVLVRPQGWVIPPEATLVHGITQEAAEKYGLKLETVVGIFLALVDRAELLVAHNHDFDEKMMRREMHHLGFASRAEELRAKPNYCTMKQSTNILQLPGRYGFKWPNLQEAHTHFTGKPFDGAHDAMADVRACAAVYFAMNPLPATPAVTEVE